MGATECPCALPVALLETILEDDVGSGNKLSDYGKASGEMVERCDAGRGPRGAALALAPPLVIVTGIILASKCRH